MGCMNSTPTTGLGEDEPARSGGQPATGHTGGAYASTGTYYGGYGGDYGGGYAGGGGGDGGGGGGGC